MDWGSIGDMASSAGEAASGLFDSAADYAVDAFQWMDNNPAATNILAGLAVGAANYYAAQDAQSARFDFERELYDRRRRDEMINPGTIEGYGSHIGTAKKGLLTNGTVAGGR